MSVAPVDEPHDCRENGHEYEREPYSSGCILVYACRWCGDEYERDVS